MTSQPLVLAQGLAVGTAPDAPSPVAFDLELARGERLAVLGPNGSGKTALLATLALLRAPLAGTLHLFGRDVVAVARDDAAASALRRRIGVAFGDDLWLCDESAAENLALPLRVHGEAEELVVAVVAEFLAWLGLGARRDLPVTALSQGERRLLATARAAVTRPDLLLLDQPLDGLDDPAAARVIRLTGELADLGCGVVVTSSRAETAQRMGCPSVTIADGRLRLGTSALRAAS